ncbi:hypothetical protein [Bifidobacterium ruminantium]|uniref:hypothetical protein n=1 Tax=Bifidobacterium ruminantium TaxID=78346 RepID=UPI001C238764|nr:hypothetical protein [Bifidobacterium ruminantium]MBU9111457.1 hypothetical protein [Bifidobacterium ruminantium]
MLSKIRVTLWKSARVAGNPHALLEIRTRCWKSAKAYSEGVFGRRIQKVRSFHIDAFADVLAWVDSLQ